MSNSKNLKFKKIFCSITLCLGMFLSAFVGIKATPLLQVDASTTGHIFENVSSSLIGSEYNFYTSSSSTPARPSNWTFTDDGVNTDEADEGDDYVAGIVDITSSKFSEKDYHTSRPEGIANDDIGNGENDSNEDKAYNKYLMLNAHNNISMAMGYSSKSITLESNSYYSISVRVYTHQYEHEARASIFVDGLIDEKNENEVDYLDDTKFTAINTQESLKTYEFFISTNESKTINIELWLGEDKTHPVQGAVFFKDVNIMRYSEDYYKVKTESFADNINDLPNTTTKLINLEKESSTPFANASFETTVDDISWKTLPGTTDVNKQYSGIVNVATFQRTFDDIKVSAPGSNCSPNNENALFMFNKEDSYQGRESQPFNIKQHGYYKITFFAKSNCNSGKGATVKLIDKTEENPISPATLTLATTYSKDSNKFRNDWTEYNFYVYGDAIESKQLAIQIWLGTKDTDGKTSGYVFIDDFRIQEIDYATFNSNSSSTNSTALNFNEEKTLFSIANGEFNSTHNENNTTTYPLTASSWKNVSTHNHNVYSGVISLNPTHFNSQKSNYYKNSEIVCPPQIAGKPLNNNVLMIGSENVTNTQTFSATNLSLSASSYYKVSMYVSTQYSNNSLNNIGGRVRLATSDFVIFDHYNIIYSDNNWHKLEYYIKTGNDTLTANLELIFDKAIGHIFFDDIRLENISEVSYNNPLLTSQSDFDIKKVDLTSENFSNNTFYKTLDHIETPNNWTSTNEADKYGITKVNGAIINNIDNTPSGNEYAMYISSSNPTNFYFTSKTSLSLKNQTYYKITVNVLTRGIEDNENQGAIITLKDNKDIALKNINTHGTWEKCTLYICPNTESDISTNVILGLGNADYEATGEVLFDNLKIEEITKELYEEEVVTANEKFTSSHIDYVTPEDPEEEPEEDTEKQPINWWVLVPSLVTALAIIVAVAGFYIRKLSFGRKPKIKTKYDRRKTLDKDISKREKIELRKQIIEELNNELTAIDKEIEEYNILAEKQLIELKNKIIEEQEEIKRKKIELEIKKKEATVEREKQLKADPTLISNQKAEKEFISFITKLDKQEMALQKQLTQKDVKLANATNEKEASMKLARFAERKEFIRNEISKIEQEIEEILKEEDEMWAEYKQAKQDAKKRKQEYLAQQKIEKEKTKNTPSSNSVKAKKVVKSENKTEDKKPNKKDDTLKDNTTTKKTTTKKSSERKTTKTTKK